MWLKRVQGGRLEVVEGVGQTEIDVPFQADQTFARMVLKDGTGRFVKPTAGEVKAAEKRLKKPTEPATASGDGSSPAPAGEEAAPEAAPNHADPDAGQEE
jgi:hypothetical protein